MRGWWLLLAFWGCADEAKPLGPTANTGVEGLRLEAPGLALRVGRVSFGGLGLEALAALSGPAHAEPAAEGQGSLELEADELSLDSEGPSRRTVLTGHVRLRRGPLELRCERLETTSDASGALVEARAQGDVRIARGSLRAEAAAARIDLARGELVLDGPLRIVQGSATLEGARAVVSLRDGRVSIQRARGRVQWTAAGAAR